MNVFFVCGAPKSGTTWLQRVLDAHPEVVCSGEGHFITRFSIPAAKVVSSYNRELQVEAEHVYEGRPCYQPVKQPEFDAVVRSFILQRLTSRGVTDRVRWVGDKTPRYTHQLDALHRIFPQARIIHMVRDPRDVAVSRLGHNARMGFTDALKAGSLRQRVESEAAAKGWLEAVQRVDDFAAAHPGLVHELRYRDLHGDTMREMTRLFGFLGVASDRPLLEEIARATSFEALSGRQAGAEDPSSFLRKGMPDDWKEKLPPEIAEMIVAKCGEAMRRKRFLPPAEDAGERSAA